MVPDQRRREARTLGQFAVGSQKRSLELNENSTVDNAAHTTDTPRSSAVVVARARITTSDRRCLGNDSDTTMAAMVGGLVARSCGDDDAEDGGWSSRC